MKALRSIRCLYEDAMDCQLTTRRFGAASRHLWRARNGTGYDRETRCSNLREYDDADAHDGHRPGPLLGHWRPPSLLLRLAPARALRRSRWAARARAPVIAWRD